MKLKRGFLCFVGCSCGVVDGAVGGDVIWVEDFSGGFDLGFFAMVLVNSLKYCS